MLSGFASNQQNFSPLEPPSFCTPQELPHILVSMSTLQDQLDRLISRKGEDSPLVQMLRNQIAAEKLGKSLEELYMAKAEFPEVTKSPTQE